MFQVSKFQSFIFKICPTLFRIEQTFFLIKQSTLQYFFYHLGKIIKIMQVRKEFKKIEYAVLKSRERNVITVGSAVV
jgi:hypothetical protein